MTFWNERAQTQANLRMFEQGQGSSKTMTRPWAEREEQIRAVIDSTAGMYGDLQGMAGKTLQEIEGLDIPLLNAPKSDSEGGT